MRGPLLHDRQGRRVLRSRGRSVPSPGHAMRRTTLLVILILPVIGVALWSRSERRRPVIGFAYTKPSAPFLDLARAALAERGTPIPFFLFDSLVESETSDEAIALATTFAARTD